MRRSAAAATAPMQVNGFPACLSKPLLTDTLRTAVGFKGFVSTDCKGAWWKGVMGPGAVAEGPPPAGCPAGLLDLLLPAPLLPAALDGYATARPAGMGYGTLRTVSAAAIKAGSDLSCQNFAGLVTSDVTPAELSTAAQRVLRNRFRCAAALARGWCVCMPDSMLPGHLAWCLALVPAWAHRQGPNVRRPPADASAADWGTLTPPPPSPSAQQRA